MNKRHNDIKLNNLFVVVAFFCFAFIIYRVCFLTTATTIDGINIKEFAEERNVYEGVITATRGSIYDRNGEVLATNISSYKLIAYLDPARSKDQTKLYHVEDKETTAKELSKIIDMSYEDILDLLKQEGLYQVEFGYAGMNLTQSTKEKIESLNLPGLDFIETQNRYYPNGDFASYTLGYARVNENKKIEGELGLEDILNEELNGVDGYTSYQVDVNNTKIAGTKEIKVDAIDGSNIYLTIDDNIQYFVEQALKSVTKKYKFDWIVAVVADAKTGEILGVSQKPSFNPNPSELDITNYLDLSVASPYEPGSIMKIYTYMAALEKGTYEGDKTFKSGSYTADDGTIIYDWYRYGWGDITYDQGFHASSNVGVINIVNNFIDKKTLYSYYKKMGFGEKTGITLANEQSGKITFTYQTEVYNAAFGQGITTTPMQHIQALTSIANDGVMLKPYIISKVTDKSGNITYQGERTEVATVASAKTTDKIKELMYDTVHSSWSAATATGYKIKGYDVIGKTGTAQLINEKTGKYYTDDYNSIKSFVGMWPKEDPEVIVYLSVKKSASGSAPLTTSFKSIALNVSKYLNIFDVEEQEETQNYEIDNYLNQDTTVLEKQLKEKNISYKILGAGSKIIDQYPKKGYILNSNETLILLTNSSYEMPDLTNYSKKEVRAICDMLQLDCTLEGYGYSYSQSIKSKTKIKKGDKVTISFKEIY